MKSKTKSMLSEVLPPISIKLYHKYISNSHGPQHIGEEKPSEWYDSIYNKSEIYKKHYTESPYYFLWTVIVDRLKRQKLDNIFDLGCGPGQFASLLYDNKIQNYFGTDLSNKAIEIAREMCPNFTFVSGNIFDSTLIEDTDYNCFITLEFLEHVEEDLSIIERIKPNIKFIGSVPNYPSASHVRYFENEQEVIERYGNHFSDMKVDTFKWINDSVFYLIEGTTIQH